MESFKDKSSTRCKGSKKKEWVNISHERNREKKWQKLSRKHKWVEKND